MTMQFNNYQSQFNRTLRILLIAAMLTIGALQVSRCSDDEGYTDSDRYSHLGVDFTLGD